MFKLLLCITVVVCSTFVGFSYSQKLYKRKTILQNFLLELKKCSTQMRYTSSVLASIFADNFMNYSFDENKQFSVQWSDMLRKFNDVLSKDDIKTLGDFGESLGVSDTQGELLNIEMYIEILKKCIADAENEINLKSKLYKTLGLSLGVTISIMLI